MSAMPAYIAQRIDAASEEQFVAGSGPGGQNANKVATTVQLRVNVFALGLEPKVYARLKRLAGSRLTEQGELMVVSREHRTQDANRKDARDKLEAMLEKAHEEPRKRAKTRVNRIGKVKRLASKKNRGAVKKARGKIDLE